MRIALVLLVVLAVVIPTALVPRTATGSENVHSSRQVLAAFRAAGLPLHRAASDQQTSGRESFSGPRGLSVIVFAPGAREIYAIGWTGKPPTTSGEGNVMAVWSSSSGESTNVRSALDRLDTLPPR